jgi:hypothetical protein
MEPLVRAVMFTAGRGLIHRRPLRRLVPRWVSQAAGEVDGRVAMSFRDVIMGLRP